MSTPSPKFAPALMLLSRIVLFFTIQAMFALGFYLAGRVGAWNLGAAWWPFGVTLTNLICVALLMGLLRAEGQSYWGLFRIRRETVKGDLLAMLGLLVIMGPVSFLPNVLLGTWLFGNLQTAVNLMVRPLPLWAAGAGFILFPVTQGLAELAVYFGYGMPRLEAQGLPRWLAVTLPAVMLGLQHIAVPFVFDVRYIAWRALMFLPFAFLVGIALRWRPRLLPYMAVIHVLMDLSFAAMLLPIAV